MLYGSSCYIFIENFPQKFSPFRFDSQMLQINNYFCCESAKKFVGTCELELSEWYETKEKAGSTNGTVCSEQWNQYIATSFLPNYGNVKGSSHLALFLSVCG